MSKQKSIHELELHEYIRIGMYSIVRVPGGWIYNDDLFVPYSSEFREPIKLDTPKYSKEEEVSHVINTIRDWIDYLRNKTKFKEVIIEGVGKVENKEALSHFEKALEVLRTHTR